MKIAKLIALVSLLAMTGILIYSFTIGDFSAEGIRLLAMPWGIFSLVNIRGFRSVLWLDRFPRESPVALDHLGDLDDGPGFLGWCAVYIHCSANQW